MHGGGGICWPLLCPEPDMSADAIWDTQGPGLLIISRRGPDKLL